MSGDYIMNNGNKIMIEEYLGQPKQVSTDYEIDYIELGHENRRLSMLSIDNRFVTVANLPEQTWFKLIAKLNEYRQNHITLTLHGIEIRPFPTIRTGLFVWLRDNVPGLQEY